MRSIVPKHITPAQEKSSSSQPGNFGALWIAPSLVLETNDENDASSREPGLFQGMLCDHSHVQIKNSLAKSPLSNFYCCWAGININWAQPILAKDYLLVTSL